MPKAESPIRLQKTLMESARINGSIEHRSAAEQIEYWADLGRKISRFINPADLLTVEAGLARIIVEEMPSAPVDPDSVFASLDDARESGELADAIAEQSPIRYQASEAHPGMLERIDSTGKVSVGQYVNGKFRPMASK